ncbi:MAG: hypothetical protein K2Y37_01150 [Pirellulales bacterium]|nr:hypothetical protein [Pirellulales bacterium]
MGKSTLASHLAIWLFDLGFRVALLDTDEQQTSAQWVTVAEPAITVVSAHEMDDIRTARSELFASHEIVVADSPGSGGDASQTITLLADFAVVPLQPSKPDVRAIKDALKFVRLAQEMNAGARPVLSLVLTFTAKADVQTRRLRSQLEQLGMSVAKAEVRRLNAFRDACDTAVTRNISRDGREAAGDLESLYNELFGECLAAIPKRRGEPPESMEQAANG